MRKMALLALFGAAFIACNQPQTSPAGDAGSTEPDVADGGDVEDVADFDIGADADAGEDADARMDRPDGEDVDSGGPDVDGGSDTDSGESCAPDADTDADGLSNCQERDLCTDPFDGDTDGDSLSDLEEIQRGTDPCRADTDGDGADDATEFDVGLDPNKPSTFDDGILDGERWRINACEKTRSQGPDDQVLDYYINDRGNWRVGLQPGFSNYKSLRVDSGVAGPTAAAVYGDSLTNVYGFVLTKEADPNRPTPYDTMEDTVRPIVTGLADALGREDDTGSNFETHGGKQAAIGEFEIKVSPKRSAAKLRQQLLFELAGPDFDRTDVNASLPSTAGIQKGWFRVAISAIYRANSGGTPQVLFSVAVAPREVYNDRQQVEFQLGDLTNTTNIAEVPDEPLAGCATFLPDPEVPKAEFYWVLDQSTSMGPYTRTVSDFSSKFIARLEGLQLDYRMGVTNMDQAVDGRLKAPGWTSNPNLFAQAVETGAHPENCTTTGGWSCSPVDEYGLENARLGLRRMLGLPGAPSAPGNRLVRTGADVVTIFMTDDSANSIRGGRATASDYISFFEDRSQVFAIADKDGCSGNTAAAYTAVASASGGGSKSICVGPDNLTGILDSIIDAAIGKLTDYKLSRTPISASLQVFLNGDFVPRSGEAGFNYFAEHNSIAFYGSYAPEPSERESGISEDFVVVQYDYFHDNCKVNDQGAANCKNDF